MIARRVAQMGRSGVRAAIRILAHGDARLDQQLLVRRLDRGIIVERLVIDNRPNSRLDGLLETAETRSQRDVETRALRGRPLARGERDGVLLGMDAQAPVVAGLARQIRGAARTPTLVTILDPKRS